MQVMQNWNNDENVKRAWAAGFYEGEGCLFVYRHKDRAWGIGLTVGQKHAEVLYRFVDCVGVPHKVVEHRNQGKNGIVMYDVRYSSQYEVTMVLSALWDYLGPIKRAQVENVFRVVGEHNKGLHTKEERSDTTLRRNLLKVGVAL